MTAKGAGRRLQPLPAAELNLTSTLASGQVFHWKPTSGERAGYLGMIGSAPVYIEKAGDELRTDADPALVARYFALDHPLAQIYETFPTDPAMAAALDYCRGMRIIRQPAWECLATFITSSMKQVAHIAQISHTLRQRYGEKIPYDNPAGKGTLHAYPTPQRIARLREEDLRACALGYRAGNLLKTARMIADGEIDLEAIRTQSDDEARATLCRFAGVGEKVANCVLLFAYERVRAFPIDVWIERVLLEHYFKGKRKVTAARLRDFCQTYFGEYGGYAQQYLFHHARSSKRSAKPPAPAKSRKPIKL